jgi:hypothetical protein
VVIDTQDFQRIATDPVRNNKRRFRNNEFARSRNEAWVAQVRILCEKMLNAIEDVERDDRAAGQRFVARFLTAGRSIFLGPLGPKRGVLLAQNRKLSNTMRCRCSDLMAGLNSSIFSPRPLRRPVRLAHTFRLCSDAISRAPRHAS